MQEQKYELYHHGVKGMKWGVRRYQNKDGSLTAAGRARARMTDSFKSFRDKRKAKKEAEQAEEERKRRDREEIRRRAKPVRALTDDELQSRIKRLTLEKQYKDLLGNVEPVSSGKKIANRILEGSIENIGKQTMTYLMGTGINKIAKDVFKSTGDIVNPKKGQKDN